MNCPLFVDVLQFAEAHANELRAQGRKIYVCPLGGSSAVGCLGYAACAAEIAAQSNGEGFSFDHVVVLNGSRGMHAGLVASLVTLGLDPSFVDGFTVHGNTGRSHFITLDKASHTARLVDTNLDIDNDAILIDEGRLGPGHGIPTAGMRGAVRLLASTEGLLLDPVYGGKAFVGLVTGFESGKYPSGGNVLFLMTDVLPGLFAFRNEF